MTKARTLADNYAADINQVTADAPLTGGGTSGTVTVGIQAGTTAQSGAVQLTDSTASTSITTAATPNSVKSAYDLANTANSAASSAQTTANAAIAKSTVDAKGDLLVGTANDTVSRLAVASTAGYVLTVDSAEATGLKWAAAGGITSASSTVATEQSTTSTSFTDLATTGPSVTLTTGTKALVIVSAFMYANANNVYTSMSYAVSGATTISAGGGALQFRQSSDNTEQGIQMSRASVVTLTAGSNTFTAKYATGSNTSTFQNREIFVIDLGS